ncbi:MAG: chemotaxis protein CheA [Proteobacteria bacterium]|nr:chemotaxis protein CheA [Pseudomonadota bacterium]MBU1686184.1 chemotaxis protein CheA [Pseudomonadota bacterium]
MAEGKRAVSVILDDMALKIMLVEPGNLIGVGELLACAEELLSLGEGRVLAALEKMVEVFKSALEQVIMNSLPDTAENFDALAQCIVCMQEVSRRGVVTEQDFDRFSQVITATGFVLADNTLIIQGQSNSIGGEQTVNTEEGNSTSPTSKAEDKSSPVVNLDFLQDKELLGGFIEEAFDHLESIEVNVLELEQRPDDQEIINNIFRPFHTIKGVSGFLNLTIINKLAHTTENLLDDVRNGVRPMDSTVIDIVLNVGDQLREMVENVKAVLENGPGEYKEFDINPFTQRIDALRTLGGEGSGEQGAESLPATSSGSDAVSIVPDDSPLAPERVDPPVQPVAKEIRTSQQKDENTPVETEKKSSKMGVSIKVDVEKLDGLVNAVGELVIMQAMVRQNPLIGKISDPKLTKDFSQLSRITTELQKTAMAMRMVPIRQTFQKMTRLVRDLSRKSGKMVDLVMVGEDTEIDRNMVDSIYDPLVHMIRNSVDHGVQLPDERKKNGKPSTGTVKLSAYQKGGNIVIEIEDDGSGLNSDKIRKKALERRLIRSEENILDSEVNNLIFLPGFSTADKITDVSGRGVGMDVVKKAVEKLRGKVEVISQPGQGSQFVIRLPLTLAIIDGIVVRVGTERYIIPTIAIQESMRPDSSKYNTVHGRGETLKVRDHLVPVIRLFELFGIKEANKDLNDSIVVVIENEGRLRALMVDELLGKQEVVIKSLGGYLKDIPGVAGGTILGDGRVGLILDLAGLIAVSDGFKVRDVESE